MKTRDYISLIAIERLLEDETLPEDIRQQARHVHFELYLESQAELTEEKWNNFDLLNSLNVSTEESQQ